MSAAVLGAAAMVVLASCQPVQPWSSELAGVDATGASPGLGTSQGVISPDGTKVAFVTSANGLGPTDTNGEGDVYVRDLATGETTLMSVNQAGTDSGNWASTDPQWSADGTRLAFRSGAIDLTGDRTSSCATRSRGRRPVSTSSGNIERSAGTTPSVTRGSARSS